MAQEDYAGWPLIEIFGVGPDGTCHCSKGRNCRTPGKHPKSKDWQNSQRVEPSTFRRGSNVGVLTGTPAGFWVLDIDAPGMDAIGALIREHGPLPETRVHRTGGGTLHYFFAMPDFDVTNRRGDLPAGIDVRGTGGQVVLPPSRSGKGDYTVVRNGPILPAPAWLLDKIRPSDAPEYDEGGDLPGGITEVTNDTDEPIVVTPPPPREQSPRERKYEASIVAGEIARLAAMSAAATDDLTAYRGDPWDWTTFMASCQLVELANADWTALTVAEARDIVLEHAPRDAGFDDDRVEEKFRSAVRKVGDKARPAPVDNTSWLDDMEGPAPTAAAPAAAADQPGAHPRRELNDVGNALRLVDWHGTKIRWAADAATWVAYNGKHWDDMTAETIVKRLAVDTVAKALDAETDLHSPVVDEFFANGTDKSSPQSRFVEWMGKTKFESRVKAMVAMAQIDTRIETLMGDFDTATDTLNAQNGVVNLRTGALEPHAPEQMLKAIATTDFDPAAKCPLFESFLERVQPDPTMRYYLQTVAGYSITGETSEQAMFLHNGHGANGKSVFLEIIREVMGGMGQKMARDTIMSKGTQTGGVPSDIAAMVGARFLTASETAAGKKLDDERIKELVGGEAQRARHLFGKWFDFRPTGKIHLATNHLPIMESGGHGMGRRLRVIGWDVTIPDDEQDKTLKDKILATEAAGVLAWLVRGAMQWYAHGLETPAAVRERTDEHVEDADPIWPFVHEKLHVLAEATGGGTEFGAVYGAYESWCEYNGQRPMSGKALSQGMVERLGHGIRFKDPHTRRSMMRVRVNLTAVPTVKAPSNESWMEAMD